MKRTRLAWAVALSMLMSAGAAAQTAAREVASPAPPDSAEPNLTVAPDGKVYLSWVEKTGRGHALRFAVRQGNGWSAPRLIAEGANWFVNWADFPSLLVLPGGAMVAHWLEKSGADTYAYDVRLARSADGGRTWGRSVVPHRDGTQTEHGFVSLLPLSNGRFAAIWLDGRNMKSGEGHAGHGAGEMTLRFATLDGRMRVGEEAVIDTRVCECCQTSAAMTSEGAIVVYRDRSADEVRDIGVARWVNGRWTAPRRLYADDWQIPGCPVNGPSVAAEGRRVAVAWFTGARDVPRVKVIFSADAGATFGEAVQVDDGAPLGRVQVVMLKDGSALVAWLEKSGNGAEIRARRVWPDGRRGDSLVIAASSAARSSGFPRMARAGDEIVFAWTDTSKPARVRTAVLAP